MAKHAIRETDEAWDERALGAEEEFVATVDEGTERRVDDAACLQMISIRLQKTMIEDFKLIASINRGIGYQTLMRQVLQRFVDCEMKRIARESMGERSGKRDAVRPETVKKPKERKVA